MLVAFHNLVTRLLFFTVMSMMEIKILIKEVFWSDHQKTRKRNVQVFWNVKAMSTGMVSDISEA
jgi:hypothetical protein